MRPSSCLQSSRLPRLLPNLCDEYALPVSLQCFWGEESESDVRI